MIQYTVSALLNASSDRVRHGFLSRHGGVSVGPFKSLNFDGRDGDLPGNIKRNKAIAAIACNCPIEKIVTVNQVHGDTVLCLDEKTLAWYDSPVDADAIITALPDIPIGVLTADCVPILIYDPVKNVAAAVHAGWKGTVKGVVVAAVKAMSGRFDSSPADLRAAIGPHIRECCLRVGDDVREAFAASFGEIDNLFHIDAVGLRLDLRAANLRQMVGVGLDVNHITTDAPCTACHTDRFYSYRKEGGKTGRQLSFIMVR
ncbi:MAG: peptidoglycan editing factor PgeF [Deltaproteobacteria bacterium]|nr:peptidoglycan editing factor PgeF [Deltaproteobacteria bacterium]